MKSTLFTILIIMGLILGIFGVVVLFINLIRYVYESYLENLISPYIIDSINKKLKKLQELPETEKSKYIRRIERYKLYLDDHILDSEALIMDEILASEKVKIMIDNMIMSEVYSALRAPLTLQQKYEIINIDEDVKKVSEAVFTGLNTDLLLKNRLIFNSTYIMQYIIGQSLNIMLKIVTDHNNSILL